MRHENERPLVAVQELAQPLDVFEVEEVGRLVQKHDVEVFEQQFGEHHLGALSAAQLEDGRVVAERRDPEPARDLFDLGVEVVKFRAVELVLHAAAARDQLVQFVRIGDGAHLLVQFLQPLVELEEVSERTLQILHHGQALVDLRVLVEIAETHAAQPLDLAGVLRQPARNDVHECGLARAVQPDHADMLAVVDGEVGVVEQHAVVIDVGQALDGQYAHDLYFT